MPSSGGSSRPREQTLVSCISCIAGRFLTTKPLGTLSNFKKKKICHSLLHCAQLVSSFLGSSMKLQGHPWWALSVKNPPASARDSGSIPGSGGSLTHSSKQGQSDSCALFQRVRRNTLAALPLPSAHHSLKPSLLAALHPRYHPTQSSALFRVCAVCPLTRM